MTLSLLTNSDDAHPSACNQPSKLLGDTELLLSFSRREYTPRIAASSGSTINRAMLIHTPEYSLPPSRQISGILNNSYSGQEYSSCGKEAVWESTGSGCRQQRGCRTRAQSPLPFPGRLPTMAGLHRTTQSQPGLG